VSREEVGGARSGTPAGRPSADGASADGGARAGDVADDASDLDAPARPVPGAGAAAPAGARARRRRRVLAAALAAALAGGGFVLGQRSVARPPVSAVVPGTDLEVVPGTDLEDFVGPGSRTPRGSGSGASVGGPTAYAQLFPVEGDRRSSTVVVSWAGVQDLEDDVRVAIAVVVDERTRVVGARLGDGPPGSADLGLDSGDLAREVLVAAGERPRGEVPVVPVSRSSGTVAVELVDEGYDLTVATAPRVHLAVVRGDAVVQLVAVPLAGPRPRG